MKEILGMWFKGHEKTDRLLRLLASDLRETKLKKWALHFTAFAPNFRAKVSILFQGIKSSSIRQRTVCHCSREAHSLVNERCLYHQFSQAASAWEKKMFSPLAFCLSGILYPMITGELQCSYGTRKKSLKKGLSWNYRLFYEQTEHKNEIFVNLSRSWNRRSFQFLTGFI